ncbi:MAG: bifunctional glutamate N-acetyltransferase/amino-acid acetyltransferase ArgJ [Epsilonproteobacteria bacterium]|nr:bifunctional glutamate N-acetyltransferase/amino-acid acetyltransferase ArgJ [Campylobacterota bacterium]
MFNIYSLKDGLANVEGFFCDGVNVGMKTNPANAGVSDIDGDVAFIRSDVHCDVSALFTKNKFQAAPLKHYQQYPKDFQTNFLLINAKNANAMTGAKGIEDIEDIMQVLSSKINLHNPLMSSTGVIGYRLNKELICSAFDKFDFHAKNSYKTARAIMTTDSFEKELCFKVVLEDQSTFHIAAVCKGAGMINPAMATMLCFITTDANIPKADMNTLLEEAVNQSFNTISVDGDTSTNDTVMLLANKKSGAYHKEAFKTALDRITKELALQILKDGEGSNKVVAFEVKGAKNDQEAEKASKALSNSLLVKTALFGEDPNWGRIASTIGASEISCDEAKLVIKYDDLLIYSKERPSLDSETESKAFKIMKQDQYKISCDLGLGDGYFLSYGCDLSYEYIKINADYRT